MSLDQKKISNIPDVIYVASPSDTGVPEITWFYKKENINITTNDIKDDISGE